LVSIISLKKERKKNNNMQYKQFNLPENHRGISKHGNNLKSVLDVQRST